MSDDTDFDDYFVYNHWVYWVVQVVGTLYAMGISAYLVLVENMTVVDTYCATLPCGTYYTHRYNTVEWTVLMLGTLRLFFYLFMMLGVLFRRRYGCRVFWLVTLFILMGFEFFTLLGLSRILASANQSGQVFGIANDYAWCSAQEIWSVPSNLCQNTASWGPGFPQTLAELRVNDDFKWLYGVTFAFVVVESFFTVVFAWLAFRGTVVGGMVYRAAGKVVPARMTTPPKGKRDEDLMDVKEAGTAYVDADTGLVIPPLASPTRKMTKAQ